MFLTAVTKISNKTSDAVDRENGCDGRNWYVIKLKWLQQRIYYRKGEVKKDEEIGEEIEPESRERIRTFAKHQYLCLL